MTTFRRVFTFGIALVLTLGVLAQVATQAGEGSQPVEEAALHGGNSPATVPGVLPGPVQPPDLPPVRRGDILMARKMYREAIETYQEGVRDAAILYNKIGIAYHQLADFKAATTYYEKAVNVDPTYAEAINNIGAIHYAQKNYKKAIRYYEEALKHAPRSASIYSNLGTAHFARKKYADAFAAYQKALELDPDVFEHRSTAGSLLQERSVEERAKFHFYLAKTYAEVGMVERALLYMRRALEEGFRDRDEFRKDPAFKDMQELEEFQALLALEPRVL